MDLLCHQKGTPLPIAAEVTSAAFAHDAIALASLITATAPPAMIGPAKGARTSRVTSIGTPRDWPAVVSARRNVIDPATAVAAEVISPPVMTLRAGMLLDPAVLTDAAMIDGFSVAL